MADDAAVFTVKEILSQVQRDLVKLIDKLDTYIELHQREHILDRAHDAEVRANPVASAAGTALAKDISAVVKAHGETREIVDHHDVLIQRLIGATTLASVLGLGAVLTIAYRMVTGQFP